MKHDDTDTVLGRLVAQMRKNAAGEREAAVAHRASAADYWAAAQREAKDAVRAANMANGWDETAHALERGAITLGDADVLYQLREQLGGAQEAIDPALPFAAQRAQLAEAQAATEGDLAEADEVWSASERAEYDQACQAAMERAAALGPWLEADL